MRTMSQHTEWLSMVEISGPFLAVGVLENIFPQGLDAIESTRRRHARSAYDEWCEAVEISDPLLVELHREWVRLVLTEILEFDDTVLFPNDESETEIGYKAPEHMGYFEPDFILRTGEDEKPLLLVSIQQPGTDLEKVKIGDGWPVSIVERMTLLCRSAGVRLGLITNGERWMLVNAPVGSTSSHASWYARLWYQEPVTLKAFQSLLGVRRWFGPEEETLPAMLEESLQHFEEVTDTLGEQVRRAVEVLVQCLDKADQDRNRELLRDVPPTELYEAGLTVMMRLVFVLCAEERALLLLGDPTYDQYYAISTMRGQLAEEADRHGPEVLERRHDAWARLLSVFRAVYGGVDQEMLRMPAMGGSLFDPDRFPFLEGRTKGSNWRDVAAKPLPIDNRTVLLLLNALQVLEQRGGALMLSYKALDVEQIGHVYEGLLEHTVQRLPLVTLGLEGSQKAKNPNLALSELESARLDGEETIVDLIEEATKRSVSAIENALKKDVDDETFGKVMVVCGGDMELANRIRPFAHLLRTDAWGEYIIYRAKSFSVTLGVDRRETGTHYTPKSLTESIVETTLEPVVYVGPAEGTPRDQWQLKSSSELLNLKICDPAMGSGAFLVQVCRWLSERLVESWGKEMADGKFITVDGIALDEAGGPEPMPDSLDDRLLIARRLVAEKCLYGVDINPLAVELAKLSIWLVTLAKGRPFGFLDHNLRHGDSLLGLHKLTQLTRFSLNPEKKQSLSIFASNIETAVAEAIELRKKLRETPIRDIRDVQYMKRLDREAKKKLENIEHIADAMIGEALASGGNEKALEKTLDNLSTWAAEFIQGDSEYGRKIVAKARQALSIELLSDKPPRKPFHWALEFPEVFERTGFDGLVGNPPFAHGKRISSYHGVNYAKFLRTFIARQKGSADLVVYFFLRAYSLLKPKGAFGLIGTNTIAQADSREVGLKQIIDRGGSILAANPSIPWAGKANVFVATSTIYKGSWDGFCVFERRHVTQINSFLEIGLEPLIPFALYQNNNLAHIGSIPLGTGFYVEKDEVNQLIGKDSKNHEVIFPFIGGKELYATWEARRNRFAIDFGEMTENEASQYVACFYRVVQLVKPKRQKVKRKAYRERWWLWAEHQNSLYNAIKELEYCFVKPRTSSTYAICRISSNSRFDSSIVVFASDSWDIFLVLQCSIHEIWAWQFSPTLKKDLIYSPTDCLRNYPFPVSNSRIGNVGHKYFQYRESIVESRQEGLTEIYNRFHCTEEYSPDIQKLRELHVEMDNAVAAAYGWDDLDLNHGFHETKQGLRFTISEETRCEILQRLLKLNHERYEEEVKQGLHDKKKKKKKSAATQRKKREKSGNGAQQNLFGEDV